MRFLTYIAALFRRPPRKAPAAPLFTLADGSPPPRQLERPFRPGLLDADREAVYRRFPGPMTAELAAALAAAGGTNTEAPDAQVRRGHGPQ